MKSKKDMKNAGQIRRLLRGASSILSASASLLPVTEAEAWGGGEGGGCGNAGEGTSCPFLCVWDGSRFVFDNDVLHGKPTSLWPSVAEGRRAYESGALCGDTLKLATPSTVAGSLRFQLREIEPEQSFIDAVSLERVRHPRGTSLYVDGDLETVHVVRDQAIADCTGIEKQQVSTAAGTPMAWLSDPAHRHENTARSAHVAAAFLPLATGEHLVLDARRAVPDRSGDTFLFLESYYRDWTPGTIYSGARTYVSHATRPAAGGRHAAAAVALAGILGAATFSGAHMLNDGGIVPSSLIPAAHADDIGPGRKSLVIRYGNGTRWVHVETVTPRAFRPSATIVRIPNEAFDADGRLRLTIEATKRHHVTSCFLFCNERANGSVGRESFVPVRAVHRREGRDYGALLARRDHTYMRTIPADVVDLEFELPPLPSDNGRAATLLFRSYGFYTPAPEAVQREAGDWVAKLDPDSRELLRSLYALKDARAANIG